jgi:hypothetical protein
MEYSHLSYDLSVHISPFNKGDILTLVFTRKASLLCVEGLPNAHFAWSTYKSSRSLATAPLLNSDLRLEDFQPPLML